MGDYTQRPTKLAAIKVRKDNQRQVKQFLSGISYGHEISLCKFVIFTAKSLLEAHVGDWIVLDVSGVPHVFEHEVFITQYEPVPMSQGSLL